MSSADILTSIIFFVCVFLIIGASVFSILAKKIIHSLFSAIIVFFAVGALFFLLNAEYNAVIQIAIYGLAVPILFAFSIMFTAPKLDEKIYLSFKPRFLISLVAGVLIALTIFNILLISSSVIDWLFTPQSNISINSFEMMSAISSGLYTKFFFAFELISLLIFVVILGLSTFNMFKEKKNG